LWAVVLLVPSLPLQVTRHRFDMLEVHILVHISVEAHIQDSGVETSLAA